MLSRTRKQNDGIEHRDPRSPVGPDVGQRQQEEPARRKALASASVRLMILTRYFHGRPGALRCVARAMSEAF
jgi:hypothetical protein